MAQPNGLQHESSAIDLSKTGVSASESCSLVDADMSESLLHLNSMDSLWFCTAGRL